MAFAKFAKRPMVSGIVRAAILSGAIYSAAGLSSARADGNMFTSVINSVGLGGKDPASDIDYRERPKLAVPQTRDLPPPKPSVERRAVQPAENEVLTQPPSAYLDKVRGQDGQVSGLKPGDEKKDKWFFGLF